MRPRPHRPIRELRRALTALGLTVAVFAMPLWTVSVHAPDAELFTPAPAEQHRVASFVMTLPPEPVPPSEPEPVPEPDVEPEPAPSPTALTEVAPPPVPEPAVPRAEPPRDAPASARVPPPPSVRLSTAGSGRKRRKKRNCQPDVPEITAGSGRTDYAVERDLIDRYAKDLDAAARLAYVSWARDDDDRIIGFKVVKIRCGSPLHEAGFQNGDVITKINGHKVRTVPQALAAYVALRVKRKLRVRGHRKDGSEMDLRYRLT